MTSVSENQNNMTTAFLEQFTLSLQLRECETFIYQACNYTILACQYSPGQEQKGEPIYSI